MIKRTTRIAAIGAGLAVVLGAAGISTAAYADDTNPTPGAPSAGVSAPLATLADNGCYLGVISAKNLCDWSASTDASTRWNKGYKLTLDWTVPEDSLHNESGATTQGVTYTKVTVQYGLPWYFATRDNQPKNPTGWQYDSYVADAADGTITFPVQASDVFADMAAGGSDYYNVWYQFSGLDSDGRVISSAWTSQQVTPTDDASLTDPNVNAAQVADNAIDLTAGGSVPTMNDDSAAAVNGYKVSVYNNGQLLGNQVLEPGQVSYSNAPVSNIRGAAAKKPASSKVSKLFSNLKPGTYRFYVSAFDGHGNSQILRTNTITVKAAKLAAATHIKVSNSKKLNVTWSAVKGKISGATVTVLNGTNVVQSTKVKAATHKASLKKLAAGTYQIRITTKDKSGHTSVAQSSITVKAIAKA